jgi:hypothetical protein
MRRMRWRGLAKAALQVRLTALAHNLKRMATILRSTEHQIAKRPISSPPAATSFWSPCPLIPTKTSTPRTGLKYWMTSLDHWITSLRREIASCRSGSGELHIPPSKSRLHPAHVHSCRSRVLSLRAVRAAVQRPSGRRSNRQRGRIAPAEGFA